MFLFTNENNSHSLKILISAELSNTPVKIEIVSAEGKVFYLFVARAFTNFYVIYDVL